MLIECLHCGFTYDGCEVVDTQSTTDVADNDVYITTDYQCPTCKGITRGTQKGEVIWYEEEFEAV